MDFSKYIKDKKIVGFLIFGAGAFGLFKIIDNYDKKLFGGENDELVQFDE